MYSAYLMNPYVNWAMRTDQVVPTDQSDKVRKLENEIQTLRARMFELEPTVESAYTGAPISAFDSLSIHPGTENKLVYKRGGACHLVVKPDQAIRIGESDGKVTVNAGTYYGMAIHSHACHVALTDATLTDFLCHAVSGSVRWRGGGCLGLSHHTQKCHLGLVGRFEKIRFTSTDGDFDLEGTSLEADIISQTGNIIVDGDVDKLGVMGFSSHVRLKGKGQLALWSQHESKAQIGDYVQLALS